MIQCRLVRYHCRDSMVIMLWRLRDGTWVLVGEPVLISYN